MSNPATVARRSCARSCSGCLGIVTLAAGAVLAMATWLINRLERHADRQQRRSM